MMLRPSALDHVGLLVTDLEKSLRFYEALGLELLRVVGPKEDGSRIAVLKVGNQELNVFSAPGVRSTDVRTSAGMDHFCLQMDAAVVGELTAGLQQAGIAVVGGPVQRRDGTSLFVSDPDGIRVELLLKNRG